MVLADQPPVGLLDLVVAGVAADAEDLVGIGGVGAHEGGPDPLERVVVEAEDPGHLAQEVELRRVNVAVGAGDVEQAAEQFLEHRRLVAEHEGHLLGVGLETAGVLLRLVEDPPDVLHLPGRDPEHLLEGVDLGAGDDAVGLGHLGAEHDDGDGERDLLGAGGDRGFAFAPPGADLVHRMTGDGADQRPQRSAEGEPGNAADDFTPDAHGDPPA